MRRRNNRLTIRLSDQELALLKKKMAESNMNYSDIIRMFIADKEIIVYPATEMKKLLTDVSKIGSNVNQLARVANSTQSVDLAMMTNAAHQVNQVWRLVKDTGIWR